MSYTHYLTAKKFSRNTDGSDPAFVTDRLPVNQQASEVLTGTYLADHLWVTNILSQMLGKVLTIVDASIADHGHKKAVKDLIRNEWTQAYTNVGNALQTEHLDQIK